MNLTPRTAMHTVTVNVMQLIFGALLAVSAGGLATYWTMMNVAMECQVVQPATPTRSDAMRRFLEPSTPLPMTGGKRY
jgi:hypothetical protein